MKSFKIKEFSDQNSRCNKKNWLLLEIMKPFIKINVEIMIHF